MYRLYHAIELSRYDIRFLPSTSEKCSICRRIYGTRRDPNNPHEEQKPCQRMRFAQCGIPHAQAVGTQCFRKSLSTNRKAWERCPICRQKIRNNGEVNNLSWIEYFASTNWFRKNVDWVHYAVTFVTTLEAFRIAQEQFAGLNEQLRQGRLTMGPRLFRVFTSHIMVTERFRLFEFYVCAIFQQMILQSLLITGPTQLWTGPFLPSFPEYGFWITAFVDSIYRMQAFADWLAPIPDEGHLFDCIEEALLGHVLLCIFLFLCLFIPWPYLTALPILNACCFLYVAWEFIALADSKYTLR